MDATKVYLAQWSSMMSPLENISKDFGVLKDLSSHSMKCCPCQWYMFNDCLHPHCPFMLGIRTYFDVPICFPEIAWDPIWFPAVIGLVCFRARWHESSAICKSRRSSASNKCSNCKGLPWFKRWKIYKTWGDNLQETMVTHQEALRHAIVAEPPGFKLLVRVWWWMIVKGRNAHETQHLWNRESAKNTPRNPQRPGPIWTPGFQWGRCNPAKTGKHHLAASFKSMLVSCNRENPNSPMN